MDQALIDQVGGDYWWNTGKNASESTMTNVDSNMGIFAQQFKNLTGRDPTYDEMEGYLKGGLTGAEQTAGGNLGYGDASGISNAYIQNQFGPEAAKYQQQQQTSQLNSSQDQIQQLINKTMGNTSSALSDPSSQLYQQFAGQMNNMGITPSSGAFQSGAGATVANAGLGAANNALQSVTIPGVQNIAGLTSVPYQQSFGGGATGLSNIENMQNFNTQAQLAKTLADMSQPSAIQKDIGMAAGAGQALGGLGQGMGGAATMTSYVCLELIGRGLLCQQDLDDFHFHIMPAMFKKGRAFWKYAMDGKKLVDAVNLRKDADAIWKEYKPRLFDDVMREPDPCLAVDYYAAACRGLCAHSDRALWDARVFRTSFWDSLRFLPRLFLYAPFIEALGKCLRRKFALFYDLPGCSHAAR